jgi:outer membrane biosynthesis protein TonB
VIRALFRWVARAGIVAGAVALGRRLLRQPHGEPADISAPTPKPPTPPEPKPTETAPAARARPAEKQAPKKAKAAPSKAAPRAGTAKAATPKAEPAKAEAPKAETPPAETGKAERPAWVDPAGGACPSTHQVKAKMTSGIFHLPGMQNYDRTVPDRCYVDAAAAEADGLRPAKR